MTDNLPALPSANRMMNNALKEIGQLSLARQIFVDWPCLKKITERFCGYVTPLIYSNGSHRSLIEESLDRAINRYVANKCLEETEKARSYVMGLTELAEQLVTVAIRGRVGRAYVTWQPFEEPITIWMIRHEITALDMTTRRFANAEHAQILLLGKILTFADMEMAGLRFRQTRDAPHSLPRIGQPNQPIKLRLVTEQT